MATPNAFEQYTVELINQARINPHGEFARDVINAPSNVKNALAFFSVDQALLAGQFAALTPVAPVSWNAALGDSSQTHTDLMRAADQQSHNLPGEPDLGARFQNAGYTGFSTIAENIYAFADDAFFSHAGFFIDWGGGAGGIQSPPGHRNAIMNAAYTEVGVGHLVDNDSATAVGPNLVTHHFGNRFAYTSQVTGVIFDDANSDHFYTIGEGVAGATVSGSGLSAAAFSTGGYNLDLAAGTHTLTFASTLGTAAITVVLGADNIKVDMYDPGAFRSSVSATLATGGVALDLLGEAAINATGNAGDNTLTGNGAANVLMGGAGFDTLIGGAGNDTLDGGSNPSNQGDFLLGGAGDDTYYVDSPLDFVDEGIVFPQFGFGGTDTIISTADFYWDLYSVGEVIQIAANVVDIGNDGTTIVGGVFNNTLIGNAGTNVMFGRGGSDIYKAGDGIDFISLSTLGVTDAASYTANGSNTVVVTPRQSGPNSYDIVFEFESGKDKIDLSAYHFASTADVLAHGVNDGAGSSYYILGDGLDYLYMVGLTKAQVAAGDFLI